MHLHMCEIMRHNNISYFDQDMVLSKVNISEIQAKYKQEATW